MDHHDNPISSRRVLRGVYAIRRSDDGSHYYLTDRRRGDVVLEGAGHARTFDSEAAAIAWAEVNQPEVRR